MGTTSEGDSTAQGLGRQVVSVRTALGATLVLLMALASLLTLFRRTAEWDYVTPKESQFLALRAALPQRGNVGYVNEGLNDNSAGYFLAQYHLAPVLVQNSPDVGTVVGNFFVRSGTNDALEKSVGGMLVVRRRRSTAEVLDGQCLKKSRDFGNGVLLLERVTNCVKRPN